MGLVSISKYTLSVSTFKSPFIPKQSSLSLFFLLLFLCSVTVPAQSLASLIPHPHILKDENVMRGAGDSLLEHKP